jgi:hypothetical protein
MLKLLFPRLADVLEHLGTRQDCQQNQPQRLLHCPRLPAIWQTIEIVQKNRCGGNGPEASCGILHRASSRKELMVHEWFSTSGLWHALLQATVIMSGCASIVCNIVLM